MPTTTSATSSDDDVRRGQPVLWAENLVKSHDGARRQLDDASLVLREGQRCCVVGHNGCGKSTLLEIISGSDRPDGGGVRLKRGVKVTAVPQEPLVAPEDATKTVRDVLLGGDGAGVEAQGPTRGGGGVRGKPGRR